MSKIQTLLYSGDVAKSHSQKTGLGTSGGPLASFPGLQLQLTYNTMEGLVKLLRRMMSGGHLEAWHFR